MKGSHQRRSIGLKNIRSGIDYLVYSNNDSPTAVDLAVAIIGRDGLIADFVNVGSTELIRFQFETAEII